jgi:hypothetical protein
MMMLISLMIVLGDPASAGSLEYMVPDDILVEIVDVQWAPYSSVSPDYSNWLFIQPRTYPEKN